MILNDSTLLSPVLFDPNDADFRQPRAQKKGKRLCFFAAIRKSNPFIRQAPTVLHPLMTRQV